MEVVKWLAGKGPGEGGADVNKATNDGWTPLDFANSRNQGIADFLRSVGAKEGSRGGYW